jgi:hypothetical protein
VELRADVLIPALAVTKPSARDPAMNGMEEVRLDSVVLN